MLPVTDESLHVIAYNIAFDWTQTSKERLKLAQKIVDTVKQMNKRQMNLLSVASELISELSSSIDANSSGLVELINKVNTFDAEYERFYCGEGKDGIPY